MTPYTALQCQSTLQTGNIYLKKNDLLQESAFKTKLDYEIVKYFNNLVSAYHDGVTALKTGARN